jgi:nucleoside 2-deoxyribosyltransferase
MDKPTVYLAGPIRGVEDYIWRKSFSTEYQKELICRIPSDIVTMDLARLRSFGPAAYMTYKTDLDLIDRSELVVANLLPMSEGYPAIGTLFELGYARAKNKLIFIVADQKRKEHPFLAFGADGLYPSFTELGVFLHKYLGVLEGNCPVFDKLPYETPVHVAELKAKYGARCIA